MVRQSDYRHAWLTAASAAVLALMLAGTGHGQAPAASAPGGLTYFQAVGA